MEEQLAKARASGDRDGIATMLARSAAQLAESGRLDDARRRLDEAAKIHKECQRPVDEARCLSFSATLCRAAGKLDLAESRATRAEKRAPDATVPKVSAATELGEIAWARHNFARAADCYKRALNQGVATGLIDAAQAALLRKRAKALAAADDIEGALSELQRAVERYRSGGEASEARRTQVELLTALLALEHSDETDETDETRETDPVSDLAQTLLAEAIASEDHWVLADLALLEASQALDEGDPGAARETLVQAREHALASAHAIAYVSSALAIAELADAAGDRVAAYEALAVGWATLGDLLGEDAAKATFEPKLQQQRERWGDAVFTETRDAYYSGRDAQHNATT